MRTKWRDVEIVAAGKGRHALELAIRFPLSREGGWRTAAGVLPGRSAASLQILVPEEGTQVRLSGFADRDSYKTEGAQETLETALPTSGGFRLAWRPRVAEAMIDRGLTAESAAVLSGARFVVPVGLDGQAIDRHDVSIYTI